MPKIRRHNVPRAVLDPLRERIIERQITAEQIGLLADWLNEVPSSRWFKRFSGMIVCGESKLVKTFLRL